MMNFFDNIISLFNYKKRVKHWIDINPSAGFYYSRNGLIGDVYGPMGSGRYRTEYQFYKEWKDTIDNEWRLRTKQRSKGSEK
jgi:hypothetical protein